MKSLTETPALLTVHQGSPGQYIVRVGDLRNRTLVAGVIKLLADGESFVVVTPSDTKVFTSNGADNGLHDTGRGDNADLSSHPAAAGREEAPEVTDPEMIAAIAAEESRTLPNAVPPEASDADPPPKTRRRAAREPIAGHDEQCGRCRGVGRVAMAMPDGKGTEAPCPICQGTGNMKRYGARR